MFTINDLRIMSKADEIRQALHHESNRVTIIMSDTGSGKTLSIGHLTEDTTLILEPRRILTVQSAISAAKMHGQEVGDEYGYAVGSRSGEKNVFNDNTRVLYASYGYALHSRMIAADMQGTCKFVVLDEAHELSEDVTIVMGILRYALDNDPDLRVVIMSATIDPKGFMDYWWNYGVNLIQLQLPQKELNLTEVTRYWEDPFAHTGQFCVQLIERGHTGIMVFTDGHASVNEAVHSINRSIEVARLDGDIPVDMEFEVLELTSSTDVADRIAAANDPLPGVTRIVVGTAVIESGIDYGWVTAGISFGIGKRNELADHYSESDDRVYLRPFDQCKATIRQQIGRIGRRDQDGCEFILLSPMGLSYNQRPDFDVPDALRLPVTHLVIQTARVGMDAARMQFHPDVGVKAINKAQSILAAQGIVYGDSLTKMGEFVTELPLRREVGRFLWDARRRGVLSYALIPAAIMEVGSIRNRNRHPGTDKFSTYSDPICEANLWSEMWNTTKGQNKILRENGIVPNAFHEVKKVILQLERQLNCDALDPVGYANELSAEQLSNDTVLQDRWSELRKAQCFAYMNMHASDAGWGVVIDQNAISMPSDMNQRLGFGPEVSIATKRGRILRVIRLPVFPKGDEVLEVLKCNDFTIVDDGRYSVTVKWSYGDVYTTLKGRYMESIGYKYPTHKSENIIAALEVAVLEKNASTTKPATECKPEPEKVDYTPKVETPAPLDINAAKNALRAAFGK